MGVATIIAAAVKGNIEQARLQAELLKASRADNFAFFSPLPNRRPDGAYQMQLSGRGASTARIGYYRLGPDGRELDQGEWPQRYFEIPNTTANTDKFLLPGRWRIDFKTTTGHDWSQSLTFSDESGAFVARGEVIKGGIVVHTLSSILHLLPKSDDR